MSWIEDTKNGLCEDLKKAALAAREQGSINFEMLPEFVLEAPREAAHGDFAANIAMLLARAAKCAPRVVATAILENLPPNVAVESVEVAGAGFINFKMKKDWLAPGLRAALQQGKDFGTSSVGAGKRVQVEFVSANPTGELHMGNARGAAIGDTLANLLQASGHDVSKEFYINDAGNQIDKFGLSLEARYFQQLGREVEFPEDGYHGEDITNTMRQLIAEKGDYYLTLDEEPRRLELIDYALTQKITDIKSGLARFGVHYDVWFSEKTLHESGAVAAVVRRLQDSGYVHEQDGALWFDADKFGAEKPEVLVRANGIATYYAADIAYHCNKFDRGFDQVINIWGADHHGHVARLKGAITAAGYPGDRVDVILMQLVRLIAGGEVVRMSKRAGTYVTLEELMDDVGVDAARFFFVMRNADSQMDFDLDLAKAQSSDNPVFYVQYAHARICSILRQAAEQGIQVQAADQANLNLLIEDSERTLIRKILELPAEIAYDAINLEPHRIAQFAMDLAALFHSFYNGCRVLGIENDLQQARLQLCQATAAALAKILKLMGVTAPEKM